MPKISILSETREGVFKENKQAIKGENRKIITKTWRGTGVDT